MSANSALDQFFTQEWLARWLVDWAQVESGQPILEPGAGHGAIVRACPADSLVVAVEIDPRLIPYIKESHPNVWTYTGDYFEWDSSEELFGNLEYHLLGGIAVSNPPYSKPIRGIDGLFIEKTLPLVDRGVFLVHSDIFHGKARRQRIWNKSVLTRVVHFEDRPRFDLGDGMSPMADYVVIELHAKRKGEEKTCAKHSWVSTAEIKAEYE